MNDREYLACFAMPAGSTITGRSSSIRNVFVASIVPLIKPTAHEIKIVLDILGMSPGNMSCAYCGGDYTEWDHLRPLVENGRPTGYFSSIRNLVPACGKCNQSKGKRHWHEWMLSSAPRSPKARGVKDLDEKIGRLESYEKWAQCEPLKVDELVEPELLSKFYLMQTDILLRMKDAQELAVQIAKRISESAK